MSEHKGLPVHGYQTQPATAVDKVNANKVSEEKLLRRCEELLASEACDPRWVAIARTHFEQGFMALNRAVFQPQRIKLPEDGQ
jgi:hypothetical protein